MHRPVTTHLLHSDVAPCSVWFPALPEFRNASATAARALLRDWVRRERASLSRVEGGLGPLLLACATQPNAPPPPPANAPLLLTAAPLVARVCRTAARQALDEGALAGLVGLGPGLTPSGDDFLIGLAATLTAIRHPLAPFLVHLEPHFARRTTDVSAAFLAHAARGEYSELLHDALSALLNASGSGGAEAAALGRLLSFGSSSGADTLMGVWAALTLLIGAEGHT